MATNITTNTTTSFPGVGGVNKPIFVKVTGTWGSATCSVRVPNGNGEYEEYPLNGSQTANFAYWYTGGDEKGLQLVTSGGTGIDLWAQVFD